MSLLPTISASDIGEFSNSAEKGLHNSSNTIHSGAESQDAGDQIGENCAKSTKCRNLSDYTDKNLKNAKNNKNGPQQQFGPELAQAMAVTQAQLSQQFQAQQIPASPNPNQNIVAGSALENRLVSAELLNMTRPTRSSKVNARSVAGVAENRPLALPGARTKRNSEAKSKTSQSGPISVGEPLASISKRHETHGGHGLKSKHLESEHKAAKSSISQISETDSKSTSGKFDAAPSTIDANQKNGAGIPTDNSNFEKALQSPSAILAASPLSDPNSNTASTIPTQASNNYDQSLSQNLLTHAIDDPSLQVALFPGIARVSMEVEGQGDIAIQLRVRDGIADVRVEGSAAQILNNRVVELEAALANEGLQLGNFGSTPNDGRNQYQRYEQSQTIEDQKSTLRLRPASNKNLAEGSDNDVGIGRAGNLSGVHVKA